MARAKRELSEDMKKGLLHWFNTVGSGGCGGERVELMGDLWKEHVPALLAYLKSECKNRICGAQGTSAMQVYEDAMTYMKSSTESEHMATSLNAYEAANGNDLEISKFLLLFWHELCISDTKTIEKSISFMKQVDLEHTMGDAIEWMNRATEDQDYSCWYHVLFNSQSEGDELEDRVEARTPVDAGDATTPTGNESLEKSIERKGEETFTFTTPSNETFIHTMRHSFYERDVSSMRNSLMQTPRLSARRQLPLPNSEPRPFIAPHLPVSRGSPIAEQLHSPAMREKRREREMRALQQKLSLAQEERDAKEIEVKKLTQNANELYESNRKLKEKLSDQTRETAKETGLREELETEMEELKKERRSLIDRNDELIIQVKKLKHDYEISIGESTRLTKTIEDLEEKLVVKLREMTNVRDELEARTMAWDEARQFGQKEMKNGDELRQQVMDLEKNIEEMKEDWRRRMQEKEDQIIEIESSNHGKIGEMNECVMKKEAELNEVKEELEKGRRKGEELKKKSDEEIRKMKEDIENEKTRMREEIKEKANKLEELEKEKEKMNEEYGDKTRELSKQLLDMEFKKMGLETSNISLKQKLSSATSSADALAQEVEDLKKKNLALAQSTEQLKETIGEMEEERKMREGELSRMREVKEINDAMKEKIKKLMKENEEASEKAYAALLENDKFTGIIEKMRGEEDERIKEQEWNETCLRSEIMTANKEKEHAEEDLRMIMKEREEEKKLHDDTIKELNAKADITEKELKDLQFVHKNVMRKLKGLENAWKKNEETKIEDEKMKMENEEMKEKVARLERELEMLRQTGQENMDTVVRKKKELEMELMKKENNIDKLKDDIGRLTEGIREQSAYDTSMTTVRNNMRGSLIPQKTLMDFDEEPTQLEAKSNLSAMKEKEKDTNVIEGSEYQRGMERIVEDKENCGIMMPNASDRRQLAPVDSNKRIMEIADRNTKTLPHMRSHHAVEQMSPNFSQNGLKEGVVRPASTKKLAVVQNIRNRLSSKK